MLFMTAGLLLTLLIILVLFMVQRFIKTKEFYKKASLIPGPPNFPLIGNLNLLFKRNTNLFKALNEIYNLFPSSFRVWIGNILIVILKDPEHIKTVLLSPNALEKMVFYKTFEPYLGQGIFTAPVSSWRIHRKLLSRSFNTRILQNYVDIFQNQALILVKKLETEENRKEFHLTKYLQYYTLHSIMNTLMGDFTILDDELIEKYIATNERLIERMSHRLEFLHLLPDFIFKRTQLSKELNEDVKFVNKFADNVMQRRREILANRDYIGEDGNEYKSFIDILLGETDDTDKLTNLNFHDEFNTMIAGALDTSLLLASYTILILSSLPEIQEKVYQELEEMLGNENREKPLINFDVLNRMDYLDKVIKETLRYFPVVPTIFRKVTEDINLGEYTLPKGTNLLLSVRKLHHNEKLWKNPKKFDPDRFLPEEVTKRHAYSYLPFSAGSRNCIGFKFGTLSVKVLIATILRTYVLINDNIVPLNKIKLSNNIFLKPIDSVKIRIKRRS